MNSTSHWCFVWTPLLLPSTGRTKAALLKATQWSSGEVVSVSFLDGDDRVKEKVKRYAQEWTSVCRANINLEFRKDTTETKIRISFRYPGSWSALGRACMGIQDRSQPTMNFGWLKPDSPEDEMRRVVLHEFGHALGLIHEHQNPRGGIRWDREAVIRDLSGFPHFWDAQTIESNVFKPFAEAEVRATPVDEKSIMLYPIPPHWTHGRFSAGLNAFLSKGDCELIRAAYP